MVNSLGSSGASHINEYEAKRAVKYFILNK